jgi:hypothetical protein
MIVRVVSNSSLSVCVGLHDFVALKEFFHIVEIRFHSLKQVNQLSFIKGAGA